MNYIFFLNLFQTDSAYSLLAPERESETPTKSFNFKLMHSTYTDIQVDLFSSRTPVWLALILLS